VLEVRCFGGLELLFVCGVVVVWCGIINVFYILFYDLDFVYLFCCVNFVIFVAMLLYY